VVGTLHDERRGAITSRPAELCLTPAGACPEFSVWWEFTALRVWRGGGLADLDEMAVGVADVLHRVLHGELLLRFPVHCRHPRADDPGCLCLCLDQFAVRHVARAGTVPARSCRPTRRAPHVSAARTPGTETVRALHTDRLRVRDLLQEQARRRDGKEQIGIIGPADALGPPVLSISRHVHASLCPVSSMCYADPAIASMGIGGNARKWQANAQHDFSVTVFPAVGITKMARPGPP
jgi:hypothetical protein